MGSMPAPVGMMPRSICAEPGLGLVAIRTYRGDAPHADQIEGTVTSFPPPAPVPLEQQTRPGLTASFTPLRLVSRGAHFRKRIFAALISLGIWMLFFAISLAQGGAAPGSAFFVVFMVGLAVALGRLTWAGVEAIRASREARRIIPGWVLEINPGGLVLASRPEGEAIAWERVRSVHVRSAIRVPGPRLVVEWDEDSSWRVPLVEVDFRPQDLDSALRAFSRGRFGLDLTRVAQIW